VEKPVLLALKQVRPIREPNLSREGAVWPRIGRVGVLEKVLISIAVVNPLVNKKIHLNEDIFF
jgi:hypothetical protein